MRVCILKTHSNRMYPSSFPGRPCRRKTKKNFRIKVEAIQQRRRPHISAMRQAEYTKDEAADWSLGQEEWSIRPAILQNELFVLIHLSGKIKTIKYYFTVLLNMYSHVSKESIYRKKVEGWKFQRIIKHIGLKWSK